MWGAGTGRWGVPSGHAVSARRSRSEPKALSGPAGPGHDEGPAKAPVRRSRARPAHRTTAATGQLADDATQGVRRLAAAVELLEGHRDRLLQLRDRADALRATDLIVVDGENAVLGTLEGHLGTARSLLERLRVEPGEATLGTIEDVASPSRWRALDEVEALVGSKDQILAQARSDVQARLGPWTDCESAILLINGDLAQVNAVLPREVSEGRDRMLSLVGGVRKALDGGQLMLAHTLLRQLEQPSVEPAQPAQGVVDGVQARGRVPVTPVPAAGVKDRMESELTSTRQRAGRVQLTVLRGPLDAHRYDYTLMLLAPGSDGHVGVNIQDTSTIVEQDRQYFLDVMDRVGGVAYDVLRRALPPAGQRRDAAPSQSGPTHPPAGAADLRTMGSVLYKLLIPDRMKDELARQPQAQLVITTNDLELPWELMFDGEPAATVPAVTPVAAQALDHGNFVSLQRPVARMPVGRSRARSSPPPAARSTTTRRIALVAAVGKPRLEQVKGEVHRIKERMEQVWPKGGVQIDLLVSDEADAPAGGRFREVLLSRDYDIVHFAGHAAYDPRRPDQSSLLLDGGEVCFAQKIQRLLAGHPLVFLNACETARLETPRGLPIPEGTYEGDPKEGLASAFVYGGALACVGATWPVVDKVAAEFAVAFYSKALEGQSLGQAILEARQHTARAYPTDPSWAAFVLYGDPGFRWAALTS